MRDPDATPLASAGPAAAPPGAAPGRPRDPGDHPMTGAPVSRIDGLVKVTGAARYAAEVPVEGAVYGALVQSTVARGRIRSFNTREAERAPGVLRVLTTANAPRDLRRPTGFSEPLPVLQTHAVYYEGQSIGIVVAATVEQAEHAARLVHVEYDAEDPRADFEALLGTARFPDGEREEVGFRTGDLAAGRRAADVVTEHTYETPIEHHHPIEPHATVAVWSSAPGEPRLTVYDSTQGVWWVHDQLTRVFGLAPGDVRVVSRFVGGGFGSKTLWPHTLLTALAAREVGRPVRLALTRPQMVTSAGHRARTVQTVTLGARRDGRLTMHRHAAVSTTSTIGLDFENTGIVPRMLYACPNREVVQRVVPLDMSSPTAMRAPGEASGSFGMECAMDELAAELGMDPIALRLANEPAVDPETGEPWSSRSLVECLRLGAETFGWSRRTPAPRSMRQGHTLVGYGVAAATYPTFSRPSSARVSARADGTVLVETGTQEIGTGNYTIAAQIAARVLGVPVERVSVEIGDTALPRATGAGGSSSAASVGTAVDAAATALRAMLVAAAVGDAASPLAGLDASAVGVRDGRVFAWTDRARGEPFAEVARRRGEPLSAEVHTEPGVPGYSKHAFGAHFCEVHVDEDFGEVRVARFHGVYGAGRILNAKTARSQFLGGIVMGIGMALMEETAMDARFGRYAGAALADYHVPVHADIRDLTVEWVEEHDPYINPLGVKGVGEISMVGAAAAVANAVAHATGRRVRSLPITPDKVFAAATSPLLP